jgi:hypothetical protein
VYYPPERIQHTNLRVGVLRQRCVTCILLRTRCRILTPAPRFIFLPGIRQGVEVRRDRQPVMRQGRAADKQLSAARSEGTYFYFEFFVVNRKFTRIIKKKKWFWGLQNLVTG